MREIRVAWLHNFDPDIPQAGVFMWTAFDALIQSDKKRSYKITYSGKLNRLASLPRSVHCIACSLSETDIVHVQYGSLLFFLTSILNLFYRRTLLVSLRGSDIFVGSKSQLASRLHNTIAVTFTKLALNLADHVITVSEKMTERVIRCGFARENITCLPSPLHSSFLSYNLYSCEKNRKVFFSAVNPKSPNKRFWLAQSAVALLPNTDLFLATELDREEFITELASSGVVLLTSGSEGWPNVVKEGLALGVPFVTTDVSDMSAISSTSKGLCHVCDDTPEALAAALSKVLNSALTIEQRKELRSIVRRYSPEDYVAGVAAIYDAVRAQ